MKHIFALLAPLLLAAPAYAQSEGDGLADFCATAPLELMSSLDGVWSMTQHRGHTLSGAGVHPIPAHPPKPLQLTYYRNFGFAVLSADGQEMVMLPADSQATAEHIDSLLLDTGLEGIQTDGTACDWYAMPSFVGTNTYVLQGSGPNTPSLSDLLSVEPAWCGSDDNIKCSLQMLVCYKSGLEDVIAENMPGPFGPMGWDYEDEVQIAGEDVRIEVDAIEDERCATTGTGDMSMTIFLRFTSPDSATGVLSFRGHMVTQGMDVNFAAQAGLSMTR